MIRRRMASTLLVFEMTEGTLTSHTAFSAKTFRKNQAFDVQKQSEQRASNSQISL